MKKTESETLKTLVALLQPHAGETGENEGAVEVLKRKLRELSAREGEH